jgi:hypothetical protein
MGYGGNVPALTATFPFADLSQFVFAQRESQFGFSGRHGRVHQARRNRIIAPGFWSNQNQKPT